MIEGTDSFKKRYKVITRISEGNFGCVFKALDTFTSSITNSRRAGGPEKAVHKFSEREITWGDSEGNRNSEIELASTGGYF